METNSFYSHLNKEAKELKNYLSDSVENFIDGTISYISTNSFDSEKANFLKPIAQKKEEENAWYKKYDQSLERSKTMNNYSIDVFAETETAVKNYDFDINLNYGGTGFRLYEFVVAHKIGLDSFLAMPPKEKKSILKDTELKLAEKAVSKSSFEVESHLNNQEFGNVELKYGIEAKEPFIRYSNFQADYSPKLVAVNDDEAVMTCLEAWLDMNLAEGLMLLNEFLLDPDQPDFIA